MEERNNEMENWRNKNEIEYATPLIIFNLSPNCLQCTRNAQIYIYFRFFFSVAAKEIWYSFKINKLFPVRWIYFENDSISLQHTETEEEE